MKIYGEYDIVKPGKILVRSNGVRDTMCESIMTYDKDMVVVGEKRNQYLVAYRDGWRNNGIARTIREVYNVDVGNRFYHIPKRAVKVIRYKCVMS